MKLSKIKILVTTIIATSSCISPEGKNGSRDDENFVTVTKVSDFFPAGQVTKVFSGGFENQGMKQRVLSIQNNQVQILQEDSGTSLILVYEVTSDQIRLIFSEEEHYTTEKLGHFLSNRNNVILKAPLEVGTKWDSDHGGYWAITAIDIYVKTPAGTYKAVEVTFSYDEYETKYYFAKGLGIIKTVSDFATTELIEVK